MAGEMDLGKKVGPLPLGVWIAVVGGGLALAFFVNRRTANTLPLLPDSDVGTGGSASQGGFTYDPPSSGGGGGSAAPSTYDTNDAWGRAAILYLLSEGKDPGKVTLAVSRYLGEQPLTAEYQAMVSLAIAKLGPPPQLPVNAPDLPNDGTPATPPPPAPVEPTLTAPKNLRTWGNGPSVLTVPLQWDKVPGAAYYRVYRKGVAFNIGASTDTKTTIGGLMPKTSYTFHVRAVDSKGNLGPASEPRTFKTKG